MNTTPHTIRPGMTLAEAYKTLYQRTVCGSGPSPADPSETLWPSSEQVPTTRMTGPRSCLFLCERGIP
jgi:hypothetical protein